LGKHAGAFKSNKRRKELLRQKKQEEKRLKRFKKDEPSDQTTETAESLDSGEVPADSLDSVVEGKDEETA